MLVSFCGVIQTLVVMLRVIVMLENKFGRANTFTLHLKPLKYLKQFNRLVLSSFIAFKHDF